MASNTNGKAVKHAVRIGSSAAGFLVIKFLEQLARIFSVTSPLDIAVYVHTYVYPALLHHLLR